MPRSLVCPHCGALLPTRALRAVVVCTYCHTSVSLDGAIVRAADVRERLASLPAGYTVPGPRAALDGVPYRVMAHIASGDSTQVFLAERAHRVTERVLLKVLRVPADEPRLRRSAETLRALARSDAQGAPQFTRRLPQVVSLGMLTGDAVSRPALAVRHLSGFVDSLDGVREAYPAGIDPRHAVWLWRRILESLGFVHRTGWVHAAVLPRHVIVHAADHGAMLVGGTHRGALQWRRPGGAQRGAPRRTAPHLLPVRRGDLRARRVRPRA